MALVIGGWFVTLVVLGVMSGSNGRSHASSDFVWHKWQNNTGYNSNVLVFVLGMLNGSFAIGTPDCTTHMSEEIPKLVRNTPKAIGIQMTSSFRTTLVYLIVLLCAISDFDKVLGDCGNFLFGGDLSARHRGLSADLLGRVWL